MDEARDMAETAFAFFDCEVMGLALFDLASALSFEALYQMVFNPAFHPQFAFLAFKNRKLLMAKVNAAGSRTPS